MSLRVLYSRAARGDLDDIWKYSAEKWGERRADTYVRSIHDAVVFLSGNPGIARSVNNIREGMMKYAVGSHVVYLRIGDESMSVTRILHSRMDAGRHL